ncbi:MAG: osmoprotectant NAGGN system M42 family peptidase [Lysobacterales bacterium]
MVDRPLLQSTLLELLAIPSPSGFTNEVVRYIASQLESMGVEYDITRRGTIRARFPGAGNDDDPAQAIVNHVDTIGAMVRAVKPNGRLAVAPIGFWSSRFAEGVRVTLFSGKKAYRGTLLPTVRWGVSHDRGVNDVPLEWDHLELRLDVPARDAEEVADLGVDVGDFIALDSAPEVLEDGFIVGRNLDNKAGAAAVLATMRHIVDNGVELPRDTYFLFTVTETVGSGAGSAILPSVSELVTVDFASVPAGEEVAFERITIASGDAAGPYDYHLTAHLHQLAVDNDIPCRRRVLAASHNDAASALAAGHDVRTAVITYAGDASHSVERTHFNSLENIVKLLLAYMCSEPTFRGDTSTTTVSKFSHQIDTESLPEQSVERPDAAEVIRRNQ